jgi:hypothetical protein
VTDFVESEDSTEFGGDIGMFFTIERSSRSLPTHQQLWEIAARTHPFGGVGTPALPVDKTPVPKLLPGETEADRA